jgi:UDP-glucose/iron transport system ATP-binding protein
VTSRAVAGEPLFAFESVSLAAPDGRWRLHGATGRIEARGVTTLVGPSGSGKSTLLRCCNRLELPSGGVVRFRGTDVVELDPLQLRRHVAMVFQRPTPFPGTCRENLLIADAEIDERHAAELLARVQLGADFLDRNATQLSGGEAQRLCLARALAAKPEVVLMDEVTSSLDPAARVALEELARKLAIDGVPIVWVTHDLRQVRRIADHVLVVMDGRIVHSAPIARLMDHPPPAARAFLEEVGSAE